ncbi:MAG: fasciclin domain-containing protein [Phycisphaerae bacterium]|nr:fasciclin domain-containing protein [Phycisphaerae bacterium]
MKRIGPIVCLVALASSASYVAFAGGEKPAMPAVGAKGSMNVVETAIAAGDFKTLVTAVKAAGLAEALSGKGPFTVFAPTDAAFGKLPAGTVESLLKPENKATLANILKYHVLGAEVMAADAVKMSESTATLQGTPFRIVTKDGKVMIGNDKGMATIVKTDIKCSNGVIHVIDAVIMPK